MVGAGVSGTYLAWRLAAEGKRVALFEASHRIGGRLYSQQPDDMPHLRAELGGMRFPHHHRFIWNLANHLGLEPSSFPKADDINFFFLRGRRLQPEDLVNTDKVPYFLSAEEQGKDPETLLFEMFAQAIPGLEEYEWRQWQTERQNFLSREGKLLSDIGFWNLLLPLCSKEAYSFIRDAAGYETAFGNFSAVDDAYFMMEHLQGGGTASGLVKGLASLPQELARRFEGEGGSLYLGRALSGFELSDGALKLSFRGQSTETAGALVLAMPRRSLELLAESSPLFGQTSFLADLQAVRGVRACKMFLGFERPWWRDLGIKTGRSSTDLPIRQCYYFGTEGEQNGADPANTHSLLMAGYNDGASVDFWSGYQAQPLVDHRLGHTAVPEETEAIPAAMLREIHRQLELMHGCKIPAPTTAYFRDWEGDPYGGGWHAWETHSRRVEVMRRMRRPLEGAAVHVCGEAYSNTHGWAQGALNSAELVCQEQFCLAPAPWLPEDHLLD